jgi:hypothetical protein
VFFAIGLKVRLTLLIWHFRRMEDRPTQRSTDGQFREEYRGIPK